MTDGKTTNIVGQAIGDGATVTNSSKVPPLPGTPPKPAGRHGDGNRGVQNFGSGRVTIVDSVIGDGATVTNGQP